MAILQVLKEPDARLRKVSKPVTEITPDIKKLLSDMVETMKHEDGIGLAAPQINIQKRIIVLQISTTDENEQEQEGVLYKMINPIITKKSEDLWGIEEGCLSVPNERVKIDRPYAITVEYIDENNQTQILEAEGILSICIQHEIDHLDGKLVIDYLSTLKKNVALKRLEKHKKTQKI